MTAAGALPSLATVPRRRAGVKRPRNKMRSSIDAGSMMGGSTEIRWRVQPFWSCLSCAGQPHVAKRLVFVGAHVLLVSRVI